MSRKASRVAEADELPAARRSVARNIASGPRAGHSQRDTWASARRGSDSSGTSSSTSSVSSTSTDSSMPRAHTPPFDMDPENHFFSASGGKGSSLPFSLAARPPLPPAPGCPEVKYHQRPDDGSRWSEARRGFGRPNGTKLTNYLAAQLRRSQRSAAHDARRA